MNYKKITKQSAKFVNEDEAYIHVEMKDKSPEIIVSGHSVAILYCISIIINKLAKVGSISPLQLIDALRTMCEK